LYADTVVRKKTGTCRKKGKTSLRFSAIIIGAS